MFTITSTHFFKVFHSINNVSMINIIRKLSSMWDENSFNLIKNDIFFKKNRYIMFFY